MRNLFFAAILVSSMAYADTVTISWTPPAQRVDGSSLPASEIGGYTLRQDGVVVTDAIPGESTSYQLTLGPGDYCFDMSTTDTEGRNGPFSDAVCKSIRAVPGAPRDLTINIAP